MKVIDLLNKIANGEEAPYGIMGGSIPYYYDKDRNDFVGGISNSSYFTCFYNIAECLNLEVELIEEDKEMEDIDKEMSKLQSEIDLLSNEIGRYHNKIHSMRDRNNYMKETLKDLQKVVNVLKRGE